MADWANLLICVIFNLGGRTAKLRALLRSLCIAGVSAILKRIKIRFFSFSILLLIFVLSVSIYIVSISSVLTALGPSAAVVLAVSAGWFGAAYCSDPLPLPEAWVREEIFHCCCRNSSSFRIFIPIYLFFTFFAHI